MIKCNKLVKYLPEIVILILLLISVDNSAIRQTNYYPVIVSISLFIYFAVNLYRDITNRHYSTSIFIIIIDVLQIVVFMLLCYLYFMYYDETNVDILWSRKINIQRAFSFIILMVPVKFLLESQRFKK